MGRMKARELLNIGYKQGPVIGLLLKACQQASALLKADEIRSIVHALFENPSLFLGREIWGDAAQFLHEERNPQLIYDFQAKPFKIWGEGIETEALAQMERAMELPVAIAGAVMPDCHLGYSVPIGGVLATENSVIPSAVGVDIACRMMMTVLPFDRSYLRKNEETFVQAIEDNTCFGKGGTFSDPKDHDVMHEDWSFSPIVKQSKETAQNQLGTSGSGNHFLDVGIVSFSDGREHVALLSHSGSRGAGARVAEYYTKLAMSLHPKLPPQYKGLAWLSMDKEGAEYWAAMELMGRYAAACHEIIHRDIAVALGVDPILKIENHHNFAFREQHGGKELIVHRKGATPAGIGIQGIIPGSMGSSGFVVSGKGNPESLCSASHGAGRAMSRTKSREKFRWNQVVGHLNTLGIRVLSAGLDECPGAYKDIRAVMEQQSDLVDIVARFDPVLVKMSDDGTDEG